MGPRAARWTLALLLVGAGALTLGPLPVSLLDATSTVVGVLTGRSTITVRAPTEQVFNVLLFLPLAALAVLAWPRWRPVAVWVACVAVSVGIEATQALVLTDRVPSVRDVLLNSTGAAIGVALGAARRASGKGSPDRPSPRDTA